ncbi:AIM24 family protein [Halobacterium wangiae]|uniref:AIM24 family protein n=1 Tax=Halobacterium wangiae TaxID=2902623 RepID=UPI001E3778B3|nr:AIM24 family protein [Halobacterium wangiae]
METAVEDGVDGVLIATLDAGESLLAAAGALVDHTGGLRVERAREGVLRTVANAARKREQTPVRVTAERETTARFAPEHHGELVACEVGERRVAAARTAFLAATDGVRVGADRVGNAPDRGHGLFLTTLSGAGTVFLASRGRVERVDVADGEGRVVSADHVVAFDSRADVSVERISALEDATATCRIGGPGTVWVGTRRRPR